MYLGEEMRFNWKSLTGKTLAVLIVTSVLIIGSSAFIAGTTIQSIEESAMRTLYITAAYESATVENSLKETLDETYETNILYHQLATSDNTTELLTMLDSLNETIYSLISGAVYNLSGICLVSTSLNLPYNISNEPGFQNVSNTSQLTMWVSDAMILDLPAKTLAMTYYVPLVKISREREQSIERVLVLEIGFTEIQDALNDQSTSDTSFTQLLRNDGMILSNPNCSHLMKSIYDEYPSMEPLNQGERRVQEVNGIEHFCWVKDVYNTTTTKINVTYSWEGPWYVMVMQESDEALIIASDFTMQTLIFISLTIAAFVALFLITGKVIKSIDTLNDSAKEIGEGNFETKIDIRSDDEIGELARTFDDMRLNLKRTIENLDISLHKNKELIKIDKLKSNILNITSHELRTPITAMKGHLQMLEHDMLGQLNNEQKDSVEIVIKNADHLNHLVEEILDTSRLESKTMTFEKEQTEIKPMMEEIVKTMTPLSDEKNLTLNLSVESGIGEVALDQSRIKQVLTNLIGNAIKFSDENNEEIDISVRSKDKEIMFEVKDNGRGIPTDKTDKVFDIFYQVDGGMDRELGGVGLGLAITKGIVINHGGEIWVESQGSGKGCVFRFTIPKNPKRMSSQELKYDLFHIADEKDTTVSTSDAYDRMNEDLDKVLTKKQRKKEEER